MNQTNGRIIKLFKKSVRGKKEPKKLRDGHDGVIGHWLEDQFEIQRNNLNKPDIDGYELKKDSKVISFGDWSADYYVFKGPNARCTRTEFMHIFGKYNTTKQRFAWSGEVIGKFGTWNTVGQRIHIDKKNNVYAIYNWNKDKRLEKKELVPEEFREGELVLACWKAASLKKKVEQKFNVNGWFTVLKDESSAYFELGFGEPFDYEDFLNFVRTGQAYFDSGMYETNKRPYSQWRGSRKFWHDRIVVRER